MTPALLKPPAAALSTGLALLALVGAAPALGQTAFADLAAIDRAVAGFAGADIGQPGGAILLRPLAL